MLPPAEYKRTVGWTCHSDSAFCQTTLVVVGFFCVGALVQLFAWKHIEGKQGDGDALVYVAVQMRSRVAQGVKLRRIVHCTPLYRR